MLRVRRAPRTLTIVAVLVLPIPAAGVHLANRAQTAMAAMGTVPIVRVVDGDTVIATVNGKVERIRVLGINTPETHDPAAEPARPAL